ncbi:MAG: D-tyrosyl-tRNA(Tyr) deacylase [Candidatus Eremiobacteraeota bacterium]|nr:D-tyrosyl-tRNA(Tyr) deacylase [Candidatus Eremiobacteraeota bacterium]
MRAVVQRVRESKVMVDGKTVGEIGMGILVLLGVQEDDTEKDAKYMGEKIANLRIFQDKSGKMNLSIIDVKGEALVVSQFTLIGDCRKGRRPSYSHAAKPELAVPLYEKFIEEMEKQGVHTEEGVFQAMMDVHLVNDGPVTLMIDSKRSF